MQCVNPGATALMLLKTAWRHRSSLVRYSAIIWVNRVFPKDLLKTLTKIKHIYFHPFIYLKKNEKKRQIKVYKRVLCLTCVYVPVAV